MILVLLLSILLCGALVYTLIPGYQPMVRWIFSLSVSMALHSVLYLLILAAHLHFGLTTGTACCLSLLGLYRISRKHTMHGLFPLRLNNRDVFFCFLAAYASYLSLQVAEPWGQWDAWSIWNIHAKFLYYPDAWSHMFDGRLVSSHEDYPLLLPAAIALFWRAAGQISPVVPVLIALLPLWGILGLLYYSFEQKFIRIAAVLLILLNSHFILQSASQYADTLLAFFYLAATLLLCHAATARKRSIYLLTGFITACCIWIKNEGMIFFVFATLVWFWQQQNNKSAILYYSCGTALILLVFVLFKTCYAPANDLVARQSADTLKQHLGDLQRYTDIYTFFKDTLLSRFPVVPVLIIYSSVYNRRGFRSSPALWVAGLTLLAYMSIYVITPHDLQWHLITSLDRLLHQLYPSFIFLFFRQLYLQEAEKSMPAQPAEQDKKGDSGYADYFF